MVCLAVKSSLAVSSLFPQTLQHFSSCSRWKSMIFLCVFDIVAEEDCLHTYPFRLTFLLSVNNQLLLPGRVGQRLKLIAFNRVWNL